MYRVPEDCSQLNLPSLAHRLKQYDKEEARSIVRLLLECCFNISFTDLCAGALDRMSDEDKAQLEGFMKRLEQGEPVQYVIGYASFCNRDFTVRPGVLIPRPETEDLCEWIIKGEKTRNSSEAKNILDIGTGSGCIAITLALGISNTQTEAWDISKKALSIARENADRMGAMVSLKEVDILCSCLPLEKKFDIIVSNPPYICEKEAKDMEANVLEHEPSSALFVPDGDALLFYRHIADYATKALKPGGKLYFEINPLYAVEIKEMLAEKGFVKIFVKEDQFGKQRIIKAQRKL